MWCQIMRIVISVVTSMGGYILLHPDNVRDSAAVGRLALRDHRHPGYQRVSAQGLGEQYHLLQLRVRISCGIAA